MRSTRPRWTLNPAQSEAAAHGLGPALVLAGPGTGKTTTLVGRYQHLLAEGVDPRSILVSTFTRKAAGELKERIARRTGVDTRRLPIGTFHSFCYGLLNGPDMVDSAVQFAVARRCVGPDWDGELSDLLDAFERYKNSLVTPEVALNAASLRPKHQGEKVIALAYQCYQRALESEGLFDYGDLIAKGLEALRSDGPEAEVGRSFRYLMVDEYQDINPAQDALICALAAHHGNLWVVGDDDQAIYGWRGSDVTYITGFNRANEGARTFRLRENYRSSPVILHAADRLISRNRQRLTKHLVATREASAPICVTCCRDPGHEAAWVVDAIKKLIASGVARPDIAILVRTNFLTVEFEAVLQRSGIPYVIRGGAGFWTLPSVQAMLEALWTADPTRLDAETPWRGPKYLSAHLDREVSAPPGDRSFSTLVRRLAKAVAKRVPGSASSEKRLQWAGGATQLARESKDFDDVGSFLDHCWAARSLHDEDDDDAVVLSTIHQAKGLEWEAVFLCACESHLLPHERAADPEEERRLAYVAATRAKRFLTVTWALKRGPHEREPSPFIEELTHDLAPGQVERRGKVPSGRSRSKHRRKRGEAKTSGRKANHRADRSSEKRQIERKPSGPAKTFRVQHAEYGLGTLKSIRGNTWTVRFDEGGERAVPSRSVRLAK